MRRQRRRRPPGRLRGPLREAPGRDVRGDEESLSDPIGPPGSAGFGRPLGGAAPAASCRSSETRGSAWIACSSQATRATSDRC
jgi:hypothetical protein